MFNRILAALLALALALPLPAAANDVSNSTWSETDASNNGASPTGWTSGSMLPSQVAPTSRAMMGGVKRFYDHVNATVTSGGAANVQTLTYSVAPAAYVSGDRYTFIAGFTNTAATTLNVNALGAKNVKVGTGALNGGEIVAGFPVDVVYDGTQFQLLSATQQQGNWTPALKFGGASTGLTYSSQDGTYTRVGSIIVATFSLTLSAKGSSTGAATITGLPFTAIRTQPCVIGFYSNMTGVSGWNSYVTVSTATITLAAPGGTTVGLAADTNFNNTTNITGSCVYYGV